MIVVVDSRSRIVPCRLLKADALILLVEIAQRRILCPFDILRYGQRPLPSSLLLRYAHLGYLYVLFDLYLSITLLSQLFWPTFAIRLCNRLRNIIA